MKKISYTLPLSVYYSRKVNSVKRKIQNLNTIPLLCSLDLQKYQGLWYEIGKLPARGQTGLTHVTATYRPGKGGKILVENKGYKNGKKKGIRGKAWPRDETCTGGLYVQFFWPFKGDYNVIKLASDYRYAVVMGEKKSSLWILSRTPQMRKEDLLDILRFLKRHGFAVENIRKTNQEGQGAS